MWYLWKVYSYILGRKYVLHIKKDEDKDDDDDDDVDDDGDDDYGGGGGGGDDGGTFGDCSESQRGEFLSCANQTT